MNEENRFNKQIFIKLYDLFYKKYNVHYVGILFILTVILLMGLIEPTLNIQFFDYALADKDMQLALKIVLIFFAVYGVNLLLGYIVKKWSLSIENKVLIEIKSSLFNRFEGDPVEEINEVRSKKLVLLTNDVYVLISFFFDNVISIVLSLGSIIVVTLYMLSYSVSLTIVILVTALLQVGVSVIFAKKLRELAQRRRENSQKEFSFLSNTFVNKKLLKLFNYSRKNFGKYNRIMNEGKRIAVNGLEVECLQGNIQSLVSIVGTMITMLLGCWLIVYDVLTIGMFVAFLNLSENLKGSITYLVSVNEAIQQAAVSGARIYSSLFDEQPENGEGDRIAVPSIFSVEAKSMKLISGGNVLSSNLSFKLERGQVYYLTGKNGVGKSTFIDTLTKISTDAISELYINGIEIEKFDSDDLRRRISVMTQHNYFIEDTILTNIFMSNDTIDVERKEKIFKLLNIDELGNKFPEGLNTLMDDLHNKFSGGELQRISMARTLAKEADIYIFDEPMTNMDMHIKDGLTEKICKLLDDKIVLFVTHDREMLISTTGLILNFDVEA